MLGIGELTVNTVNKLKPCKRCGGQAELVRVGDMKQYFVYRCSSCNEYHERFWEASLTPWGAKRIWNRRSDNGNER